MPSAELVIVKVGTSSVTSGDGAVDDATLKAIAADVAEVRTTGPDVVLVTSGAITAGWAAIGRGAPRPRDPLALQAVSAVGQPLLMAAWRTAFAPHGLAVGQVLLSPADFAERSQYLHARDCLHRLLELGTVPVVNENDAVADDEIRFGDNDRLAALVANLLGAGRLVLLTDTDGVYTADPRIDPSATLVEEVAAADAAMAVRATGSRSGVGSGGMAAKLAAARIAAWSGVRTSIGAARRDRPISALLSGTAGTHVAARDVRLSARKAWIAFAVPTRGALVLNDGAARAVTGAGASVLRIGVTAIEGDFSVGDAVELRDGAGVVLAKGLSRTGAAEWASGDELVVHRDDLVLF